MMNSFYGGLLAVVSFFQYFHLLFRVLMLCRTLRYSDCLTFTVSFFCGRPCRHSKESALSARSFREAYWC